MREYKEVAMNGKSAMELLREPHWTEAESNWLTRQAMIEDGDTPEQIAEMDKALESFRRITANLAPESEELVFSPVEMELEPTDEEIYREEMSRGIFAREHLKHMEKYHPERLKELTQSGKLTDHLIHTQEAMEAYIKQATDHLKATDKDYLTAKEQQNQYQMTILEHSAAVMAQSEAERMYVYN
jgi:hypothetical protein